MDWARTCAGVIPCFNEAESIAEVVSGVRRHLSVVTVVDDGSTDATAERAAAAGAEVLSQSVNRGKGSALRTGWQWARERGFAWALTVDGDGQHAPEDAPAFFACAESTGAALVIGNRLSQPAAMPWARRQVNRWMTRRLADLIGAPLADSQCGFRLVNLETWSKLTLTTNRFEIESELLVAFSAAGGRVEFVPVQVIYKARPSKIQPLTDGWRWLKWWLAQPRANQREQFNAPTPFGGKLPPKTGW